MVNLHEIEAEIEKAFQKTVNDFKKGRIELEEDFRASLYHYLRPFVDTNKDLLMLLNHNVNFKRKTVRPDISIFRKNVYLVAIEMKNVNIIEGNYVNYNFSEGKKDIKKLQGYRIGYEREYLIGYQRGYFIHIDRYDGQYKGYHRFAGWKDNYFVELWYAIDTDTTHKFEVKRGSAKEVEL